MEVKQYKMDWAGRDLVVEVGRLAQQASGSVLVRYGDTTVLGTCVVSKEERDVDYLPLSVEYEEKLYAAGKIKSGRFMKREGRSTDEATLTGRMIDRTLRPCFDQGIRNDTQVVLTVLSFDKENDPDMPALLAGSLAVGLSGMPWNGPVGGMRVGRSVQAELKDGEKWVLNPTYKTRLESDFDLVISGKKDRINMLEGGANETPEDVLLQAMKFTQPHIKNVIEFQEKIIKENAKEPIALAIQKVSDDVAKKVADWLDNKLEKVIYQSQKPRIYDELDSLEEQLIEALTGETDDGKEVPLWQIKQALDQEVGKVIRKNIITPSAGKERRTDGRKTDEIRPLKCDVDILPRVHGSGLFQRGETQALSVVTLGAPDEGQTIDDMESDVVKNYMHHYNFPPFCTGETGRFGGPGRREIGHGALAEKAIIPVLPDREIFPYTIRVVSEVLSSNGSSSMASTCGSSLALMNAGVPLKSHVAGIAMGIVLESDDSPRVAGEAGKYKVLTDIAGLEDHHGGMDCKVAGTTKGVTAVQMDVKIDGATIDMFERIFTQAKKARMEVLDQMAKAIKEPNSELSPFAPKIVSLKINPDKIRDVIGPGGKIINGIIDETGVKIDIDDDGTVNITADPDADMDKAVDWVKNLTREVKVGEVFQGKVVKIAEFGAFVQILPGQDGLVHISELADHHVDKVEDILKMDQIIPVKVKKVDETGRISLTLKNIKP